MDSVRVFNDLIETIETSNLNYFINKTPFSAQISIKSTFINRFGNQQTLKSDQLQLNLNEQLISQEKKITWLESEIVKLQQENVKVNDMHNEEKVRLKAFKESIIDTDQENSDKSHLMSKNRDLEEAVHSVTLNYEQEISDHETTVREKNTVMNENIKKDVLIKKLEEDQIKLEHELETAENSCKSWRKSIKIKEKEIYETKKENIKRNEDLDQVKAELVKIRMIANQEKKELERRLKKTEKRDFLNNLKQMDTIPCGHCDEKLENNEKLRSHVRIHHQQTSSIQTEEISQDTKFVQCRLDRNILVQKKDVEQNVTEESFINAHSEIVVKESSCLSCILCRKYFFSELSLKEHKQTCQGKQTSFDAHLL